MEPSDLGREVPPAVPRLTGHPPGWIPLIGRNLRALAISEVTSKVAVFVSMAVLARFLGTVNFGRYTVVVALVTIVGAMGQAATSSYLVREGARRPEDLGAIVGNVLVLRGGLAFFTVAATVAVAAGLGYERTTLLAVVLFAVASGLQMMGHTFIVAMQVLERMGDFAAMRAQMSVAHAVAAAVAAILTRDLVVVSWGVLIVSAGFPLWTWHRLRQGWKEPVQALRTPFGATLRTVTPFAVASMAFVAMAYLDSIMVRAFKGDVQTGLYGAAYRVLLALTLIPTIYDDAVTRALSHLAVRERERMRELHRRAGAHLVMIALPIAAGGAILARPLVELVFGEPYAGAATSLAILFGSAVVIFPGYVNMSAANALGLEKRLALILPLVVLVNAGTNLWAIPRFGIEGAALTTLGSEILFFVVLMAGLRRWGLASGILGWFAKPAVATAAMAAAVWPLRHMALIVPIAVGAVVYAGALLLLRAFGEEDRELFRAVISRRATPTGEPTEA